MWTLHSTHRCAKTAVAFTSTRLPRNDEYDYVHPTVLASQIPFEAGWIANVVTWIVDKTIETLAIGVGAVSLNVNDEFLTNLGVSQPRGRELGLDDDSLTLQQEVHSRRRAAIAWCVLFGSYVIKARSKERV